MGSASCLRYSLVLFTNFLFVSALCVGLLQVSYTALLLQVKSVTQPSRSKSVTQASCCKSSQLQSHPAASQLYNLRAVIQAHSPPAASQSHNLYTPSQLHSPPACKPAASQLHSPLHTLFSAIKQRIQMILPLLRY